MQQAMDLLENVKQSQISAPNQLWVSPRLRTGQSFQPLADNLGIPLQVHQELDEKHSGENRHQFRDRIDHFLQKAAAQEGVLFICSHYDWLEESLQLIPCETDLMHEIQSHWSPLQYVALDYENGIYEFIESKRTSL